MLPDPKLAKYIDDLMQADILAWRDWLFTWLLRSTKAVTWGLGLEGPELFHDINWLIRHWLFRKKFHFSLPDKHAPDWAKVLAFIGWILITAGVAGEWYTESHIEDADATIQSFMNAKFEDAESKSAILNLRASVNELQATQLKKESAKLIKEAEDERLARIRLEEDIAPRRLNKDERAKLTAGLLQFPEIEGVVLLIQYGHGDTEAYAFGNDIAKAVLAGHWRPSDPFDFLAMIEGPVAFGTGPHPNTGVGIAACPNKASRTAEKLLYDELVALGFDAVSEPDNCNWVNMLGEKNAKLVDPVGIYVVIWPRPEGPQGAAKLRHAHNSK